MPHSDLSLNHRADLLVVELLNSAEIHRVTVADRKCLTRVVDCGSEAEGGLATAIQLAEICLAGLGEVRLAPAATGGKTPLVTVSTDQPVLACLASQYAGWQIQGENYFAMGSGPMRALARREPLFDDIGYKEKSIVAVGVLETKQPPTEEVCISIAESCGVQPGNLVLLFARTKSLAGLLQVVARSVETALHKLHELKFDLSRIISAWGSAPLPPVATNDMQAIGRTNDAILYGGDVHLWVRGDDASIQQIGPQVPSQSSGVHGRPFLEIFEAAGRDFYAVDPMLFSPARVTFHNLDTGHSSRYGELRWDLIGHSFGG